MARTVERRAEELDVERVRKDFPILERTAHGKPLVYLDSANTSQKPRQVIDAITDYYERHNANLYRAVYELAEEATAAFEEARARLARFIGAPDPSCIVFNRGTTESVNLVAHGFGRKFVREGDEILLSELEHHSNIVPWQLCAETTGARIRYIPLGDVGLLDLSGIDQLIGPNLGVLLITHYQRILNYITPDRIHVMMDGRIVLSGGPELAHELEQKGYEGVRQELGIGSAQAEPEATT